MAYFSAIRDLQKERTEYVFHSFTKSVKNECQIAAENIAERAKLLIIFLTLKAGNSYDWAGRKAHEVCIEMKKRVEKILP
jgi:hypothetical protein